MEYSGLLFDAAYIALLAVIVAGCMLYAKRKHALAFKNHISEKRYNYETVDRAKHEESERNTWF